MSLVLTAYTYMHMYTPAADSVSITITHQNGTVLASLGLRSSRTCVWLGSGHETKFWQDAVGHYELDRDRLRQRLCAIASRGHGDGVEIDWSGV